MKQNTKVLSVKNVKKFGYLSMSAIALMGAGLGTATAVQGVMNPTTVHASTSDDDLANAVDLNSPLQVTKDGHLTTINLAWTAYPGLTMEVPAPEIAGYTASSNEIKVEYTKNKQFVQHGSLTYTKNGGSNSNSSSSNSSSKNNGTSNSSSSTTPSHNSNSQSSNQSSTNSGSESSSTSSQTSSSTQSSTGSNSGSSKTSSQTSGNGSSDTKQPTKNVKDTNGGSTTQPTRTKAAVQTKNGKDQGRMGAGAVDTTQGGQTQGTNGTDGNGVANKASGSSSTAQTPTGATSSSQTAAQKAKDNDPQTGVESPAGIFAMGSAMISAVFGILGFRKFRDE